MFCKKQGFSKHTCFDNMKKHFICWHVFLHKICQHIEKNGRYYKNCLDNKAPRLMQVMPKAIMLVWKKVN